MDLTPRNVLPLLDCVSDDLRNALRKGIARAEEIQSEREARTPWYWSHTARYEAKNYLLDKSQLEVDGYRVRPGVPNSGIHLIVGDLHVVRVVRSVAGTTPSPGGTRARRLAWMNLPAQGQLALAEDGSLPPLTLIADWQDSVEGEPIVQIGLPRGEWNYRRKPLLFWRKPMPEVGADLSSLEFAVTDAEDDLLELDVDETEFDAGGG